MISSPKFLEASPWWDASRFGVSVALGKAWASGELQRDLTNLLALAPPERIVSTGAPLRGRDGADADAAGVWSELMRHDGDGQPTLTLSA